MHTKVFDTGSSLRIEARSQPLAFTRIFAILWAAGWLALEASLVLDWIRGGWRPILIVMVVWTLTGPFAFLAIIWAAAGKPEIVTVSGPTLEVWRGIGGGDYRPISAERLRGRGQVVLAPIGDFPQDTARQIAERFRSKYALAIQAGPPVPLPSESFDAERGQVDSDVLMSTLEREFPDAGTVVIGLTIADMFIRDVDWRCAFSNRRAPRLAVVSLFRMDRGCLGIRLADEETRMARLRKMVGKNIGVRFYKLPQSSHPRSMLYAYIGGPQELDTIREVF